MTPIILYNNIFSNVLPLTATDTTDGYDVLNVIDYKTYTYWQADSAGTKYISIDCSGDVMANCVGIAGHNLKTANATVSMESSADNSNWTTRVSDFIPDTDKAFTKLFDSATARYWRLKIVTATIAAQIAVLMAGERLTFPCPPESPYIPYSESVELDSARSKAGHLLGVVTRYKPIEINARFSVLSRDWVFNQYLTFWENHASRILPFFWAWDVVTYPEHVYFVTITEKMKYSIPLSIGAYADSMEINMEGIII